ncbi:uncharacterized protein LOC122057545 [Macadamia integrifolia]|uniref:uncharacterized protein LOC122057545 n=1 Tax=Macadamia integrifolia TaxID=60698 RepID=UPI001C52B00D|nr:uncharacterized protein LOC122057545 [Macadamia integrifolia]
MSGSTNEASSEGLDLNSEAVPLVEEVVSVVRVTESTTVALSLSVAETLAEQGSNLEGETAEAGLSVEGQNLLETFAEGADVREGGMGTHAISSMEERVVVEEAADVGLIKEDSERETKEFVDAVADIVVRGEPELALTLKVSASDAQELRDRGEVTEAESSVTITELTVEGTHVVSGEKTVELENSEVSNTKGDVLEPKYLDENLSFSEKNEGLEVEGVKKSNEANGVRDSDASVGLGSLSNGEHGTTLSAADTDVSPPEDGKQELISQVVEALSDQVITEDIDEPEPSVSCALPSAVVQVNYTQVIGSLGPQPDQSEVADVQVAAVCSSNHEEHRMGAPSPQLDSSPLAENQSMEVEDETTAEGGCRKLDESQFESQSQPVPINFDVGSLVENSDNHTGTNVNNKIVEEVLNQSMEVEVETAAAGGCCKLDVSQFESQSHPISIDSDVGSLVENSDNHPGTNVNENTIEEVLNEDVRTKVEESGAHGTESATDVNKNTVEEVLNEDERTKGEESGAHATHPGADGKQRIFGEVFKEDGGTDVEEMGDNVTNPETDGIQNTISEVFKEEGSGFKEMLDGKRKIASDVSKEDEGTGLKEMSDDVTHLGRDGNQKTADKVVGKDERTEISEVGDGVTCLGTDGNQKPVNDVFQNDDGIDMKDENQMFLHDSPKEDEGSETKEVGDDVTCLGSDGHQKKVEEVPMEDGAEVTEREDDVKFFASDCLDENVTKNIGGVDSRVNQKIETSEELATTLSSGTASGNDNQVFYGLEAEKEGVFSVSDLVWGKVKSHPWWPGQIFDTLDASEQAMKYRKKDSFLVAYFGDRTFAWNEASLLKPFRTHFSQMEKQSNLESFRKAVNCALDEIARRVELGLVCSCTSEEVNAKIGSQMIENTGIREESSRREGTDKALSLSSFKPEMLVEYIRSLALSPLGGVDRLELVIAQAQLLALCRSRGYPCLPKFQLCGGLVENETDSSILLERKHSKETDHDAVAISENEDQVLSGKGKVKNQDGSSRKRKQTSANGAHHRKKERSLSELMAAKKIFSTDDGNESVEGASFKPVSSSSGKKRKPGDSFPCDPVIQNRKRNISLSGAADADSAQPKQSFKVGESICRVASLLTRSPPILKCSSERLRKGVAKVDQISERSTWVGGDVSSKTPEQRRKIVSQTEHSSPDEMLAQLCLAARDPMKGYSFLTTIISFFSEFRNSVCLDHKSSWKHKMSSEKVGGKKKRSANPNTDSTESYTFDDMQDSYWTDRIVQIGAEEEPLDKSRKKRGRPRKKMSMLTNGADNSHQWSPVLDIVQRHPDDNAEQPVEKSYELPVDIPEGSVGSNSKDYNSPAALILSFSESDADCIPSEKKLNSLFRHFGPLKESEAEVLKTSNCARVVFKRRTDAEVALSSAGKFNIFGPMLVSYSLMYLPSAPAKIPSLASSLGMEDMAPQGTEDIVPQQLEYMAPQGMEGMTAQHIEDEAPQGMEDMAPEGTEDMAQHIEDVAPQDIEDMPPQGTEDMAPRHIEDMAQEGIEDVAPLGMEDLAPQDTEDITQNIEDVAPQDIEDMTPQQIENMAAEGIADMAPESTEVMAPQHIEDLVPEGAEDMARQGTEDVAPQGMDDVAPQSTEDMAHHIEYVAPQDMEDMAPQGTEDMALQHIEDMAPEGMEDIAPECMKDMAAEHIKDVAQERMEDMAPEGTEDMEPHYEEDVAPQQLVDMAPA